MGRLRTKAQTVRIKRYVFAGAAVLVTAFLITANIMGWINFSFLSIIPQYTIIPVKNFFVNTATNIRSVFADSTQIARENERLKQEIARMELELAVLNEMRLENQRMSGLLDMAQSGDWQYVGARVIAMAPESWYVEFAIDKGSVSGLAEGMPVVV